MKKIFLAAALLLMAGCEDIVGTLNVFSPLTVKTESGSEVISAGTYKTGLDFKKKEIIATINVAGKETKFSVKIAKGTKLPDNGSFEIKSTESGQGFDVMGFNETTEKRGDMKVSQNTCQYQTYQNVCDAKQCYTVPVTRTGFQMTHYYDVTTNRVTKIDLLDAVAGDIQVAHFEGESESTQQIVTYQSNCM